MAQVKPINKKKMSRPALAAMIVSIVILLALVVSLVASSGIFVRAKKGASSENFEIDGSMMSYYTNVCYQNWYSENYISILLGYSKFDPSIPFDEQIKDTTTKQTYYDFFASEATTYATLVLKYCEAARVDTEINFAEYEAEAEKYAKDTIASLKESARKNSMDFNTFLRQNFSEYVNENDLRKALVLEHIASDYAAEVYDRIYEAMTDERKAEYFAENLSSFVGADYLYFTLSSTVTPEKVDEKKYEGGKESQEYKDAVAKAEEEAKKQNDLQKEIDRVFIEKLAKATSEEEFKRILLDYKYEENFTAAYNSAISSFAKEDKPSDDVLKAFKESVKQAIIDAVIAGKDDITEDGENETETADETNEETTETKWEKAAKALPKAVITKLKSVITDAIKSRSPYTLDTEVGKFLFAGVKAQYGIEYDEKEEQGENAQAGDYFIDDKDMTDAEKKYGKYTLSVYYVTKSAYRDETMLRNVGHILFQVDEKGETEGAFKTFDDAKAKAEEVLAQIKATEKNGVVEKDVFETFGKEHTNDSNVFYEDVNKGDMVEEFEEWLFAAKTPGEVGLVKTSYGWHIMFYEGETDQAWRVSAHSAAASADSQDWYDELPYEVTVNADIFKTILDN